MLSFDLVCLSHLRWNSVFQRPHHLLSRCVRDHRVFFVAEPLFDAQAASLELNTVADGKGAGVQVVVPHLPEGLSATQVAEKQRRLLDGLLRDASITDYVLWYYTPMALEFTHREPERQCSPRGQRRERTPG